MKKFALTITAIVVALAPVAAQAGGFGGGGSKSLINVAPSIDLDGLKVLNGINVLNGAPILSGNNVSGILNGNKTSVGNGILSGIGVGILSGNSYKLNKH